jgi:tellurium resistance protein TerZ
VGVSLAKGGNVSLTKEAPGLTSVLVGLGWDVRTTTGADYDLDASAIMLNANGKVLSDQHFVFFNNTSSPDGSVQHTGDNLTGEGEGDDESIVVDLGRLSPAVTQIVFTVNSFTGQDFTQIENAFCRLVDETSNEELTRYDLSGSGSHNAQIMAKVSRGGAGEWSMTAIGAIASGRTFQDLLPATVGHL